MLEFAVVVDHFFQMTERFLGLGLIHQDQQADPLHAFQVDLLSERHQSIDDQLPHFQADDAELLEIDDEAAALGRDFRYLVARVDARRAVRHERSEEQTSALQSIMRSSYAVFCLKSQKNLSHISSYKLHPTN